MSIETGDGHEMALRTRDDLQRAIVTLCTPLDAQRSAGGARIRLGGPRASYPAACQEMEGFARMLWGIAPLLAGGGTYPGRTWIRDGVINGCDPGHPEYWGTPADRDQRLVEMAALAFSLLIERETFWTPLSARQRQNVAAFLGTINAREVHDNNWRLFRVLVNLALAHRDAPWSRHQLSLDLDRIEAFHLGNGWYVDGCNRAVDYYSAFGMHFYGLLCAPFLREIDRVRAQRLLDRAAAFASEFMHWFGADGAAIPYGRSLTYRCAQGAFWSALACAGLDAVPWGVIKGLVLRHLRWWFDRPIRSSQGLLSLGYAYPNQMLVDRYSSPCSPYWALKAFLPVALPPDAPFWRADEQPLPATAPIVAQPHSGMLLCRDGDHLFALAAAARVPPRVRHAAAKYGKFCYSTRFGFSVPSAAESLPSGAHDSALAFCEVGDDLYRARIESDAVEIAPARIVSHWTVWSGVRVTTWLVPLLPWHVRVHRVRTERPLTAAEGGFALGLGIDEAQWHDWDVDPSRPFAGARTDHGVSAIVNLIGDRRGEIVRADPNTNVLFPRAVIPTLHATLSPGEHWLAAAVVAHATRDGDPRDSVGTTPVCVLTPQGFEIRTHRGELVLHERAEPATAASSGLLASIAGV
jgi:hypothetical protein